MNASRLIIVSPVYNEALKIGAFIKAFQSFRAEQLPAIDAHLILVDDGSKDESVREIEGHVSDHLRLIQLGGNWGHQAALTAGLLATGAANTIVTMDSDLEHPFAVIPSLVSKWAEGYKIVNTIRRPDVRTPRIKGLFSSLYYKCVRLLTDLEIQEGSADFRLWDYATLYACKDYLPKILSQRVFVAWLPVSKAYITYQPDIDSSRMTRFSFRYNVNLATDSVIQFSEKPFRIYIGLGIVSGILGIGYALWSFVQYMTGNTVPGWTSLVLALLLFGAFISLGLGVLGIYMRRFQYSVHLPRFIVLQDSGRAP